MNLSRDAESAVADPAVTQRFDAWHRCVTLYRSSAVAALRIDILNQGR